MTKFRKKPIIVEAEQWLPGAEIDGVDSSHAARLVNNLLIDHAWIETLEGGHIVSPGDWIITGIAGEKYPCRDEIFRETYEPVSD